jgi:3,4-dihydroxy-2-butanone 4-phosphate synthase
MSGAFGHWRRLFIHLFKSCGLSCLLNNQFGITITNSNMREQFIILAQTATEKDKSFDLNQAGGVLCLTTKIQIRLEKFSLV